MMIVNGIILVMVISVWNAVLFLMECRCSNIKVIINLAVINLLSNGLIGVKKLRLLIIVSVIIDNDGVLLV